jgi:hypothetical protein
MEARLMKWDLVFPRDLFNHGKVYKSLGRLTMLIEDGLIEGLAFETLSELKLHFYLDGSIVSNIPFNIKESNVGLIFKSEVNRKSNYNLCIDYYGEEIEIFEDNGELTKEFTDFLTYIKTSN